MLWYVVQGRGAVYENKGPNYTFVQGPIYLGAGLVKDPNSCLGTLIIALKIRIKTQD